MKQQSRREVVDSPITRNFLEQTREEDPGLHRALDALDAEGREQLGGVLGRFARTNAAELSAQERLLARRVLGRLSRPSLESLTLTNHILDYLDLNANAIIDADELELCVEVMELFARTEAHRDTLSERELRMLYAVLRHIDADSSGRFERHERQELRRGLDEPRIFLENQRANNPLLREVIEKHLGTTSVGENPTPDGFSTSKSPPLEGALGGGPVRNGGQVVIRADPGRLALKAQTAHAAALAYGAACS